MRELSSSLLSIHDFRLRDLTSVFILGPFVFSNFRFHLEGLPFERLPWHENLEVVYLEAFFLHQEIASRKRFRLHVGLESDRQHGLDLILLQVQLEEILILHCSEFLGEVLSLSGFIIKSILKTLNFFIFSSQGRMKFFILSLKFGNAFSKLFKLR